MAESKYIETLERDGVDGWNLWRKMHPNIKPDFYRADLSGIDLTGANFSKAKFWEANLRDALLIGANLKCADFRQANLCNTDFTDADLRGADLTGAELVGVILSKANLTRAKLKYAEFMLAFLDGADLSKADLTGADFQTADLDGAKLTGAYLSGVSFNRTSIPRADLAGVDLSRADFINANLKGADLTQANLAGANLTRADFTDAQLSGANLTNTTLVETNFDGANLSGCSLYHCFAWDVKLGGANQTDLLISKEGKAKITMDNLEFAHLTNLLLNNKNISDAVNIIGKKGVLILGRFSIAERKDVLDAIRTALREKNYLPIVFDFERPTKKDFTETIKNLAGVSKFIIADITNPKSSSLELQAIVPNYRTPLIPIIQTGEGAFPMFQDLWDKYSDWVTEPLNYTSIDDLIGKFEKDVIKRAEKIHSELQHKKAAGNANPKYR